MSSAPASPGIAALVASSRVDLNIFVISPDLFNLMIDEIFYKKQRRKVRASLARFCFPVGQIAILCLLKQAFEEKKLEQGLRTIDILFEKHWQKVDKTKRGEFLTIEDFDAITEYYQSLKLRPKTSLRAGA